MPLGYKGSYQRVRASLSPKRTSPQPVTARPPSPWAVAGWILSRPEPLAETEQLRLKTVRAHCPELGALTRPVRSFATMLTERQGECLPDWPDAVRQDVGPFDDDDAADFAIALDEVAMKARESLVRSALKRAADTTDHLGTPTPCWL
ncbi:DUF4259 domain-containing protein [Streptomyces sp. NBC_01549]|uniref:DUF4259 domain-containing protein n=1 Tax=Streptomyces sp. NBC_01549 TaxID=2975874 RepID=UPI00225341F3|nr:DUF4259 domain-containing protein [Streptomyces sp. NBC_01549]MCX4598555.1 DUF4259 domain-containing protein [Streptomyces sp. NBC_01549]